MDREKKRRVAYEVIILMALLALMLFMNSLWPILLLVIVGIFICALRLLFVSVASVHAIEPIPQLPALPAAETEHTIIGKAFGLLQQQITEKVAEAYPLARWIWSNARPLDDFAAGEGLIILLNNAGGYGRANILTRNLMFIGLTYIGADTNTPQSETEIADEDSEDEPEDEPIGAPLVNYGQLAFEWVESCLLEINNRCNEAIAQGQAILLIEAYELPNPDSWLDICQELKHNGISSADIGADGITLTLTQEERKLT